MARRSVRPGYGSPGLCSDLCVCAGRQQQLTGDAALPEPPQARATVAHTNDHTNDHSNKRPQANTHSTLAHTATPLAPCISTTAAAATVPGAYLVDSAVPQPGAAPVHRLIGGLRGEHTHTLACFEYILAITH